MKTVYCDIETIALSPERRLFLKPTEDDVKYGNTKDEVKRKAKFDEVLKEWEEGEGAALDPLQAQIALIGYAIDDGPVQHIVADEEAVALVEWWEVVGNTKDDPVIVGHNIRFDAGMLVRRSWVNAVGVPGFLLADLMEYRPRRWRDTMAIWQLGDKMSPPRKLAHLCGAMGIPVKEGPITGKTFGKWWQTDREACMAYNAQDVEATRSLWKQIQMSAQE